MECDFHGCFAHLLNLVCQLFFKLVENETLDEEENEDNEYPDDASADVLILDCLTEEESRLNLEEIESEVENDIESRIKRFYF